jgi:DNA transformation protein
MTGTMLVQKGMRMTRETSKRMAQELAERLEPIGPIDTRPMFGAIGLRKSGVIFGFVHDETFFLKVDERGIQEFETQGSGPFVYQGSKGAVTSKSTWSVPCVILDDADALSAWSLRAF